MSAPVTPPSAPAPEIFVAPDADALAKEAADRFVRIAQEAIAARGRFTVALSGGSTPEKLHTLLASPEYKDTLPWDSVFCFFGDERFVPQDDPASNYGMAKRTLLDPAGIPESNRFPMPTPPGTTDLADAAHRYTDILSAFFQAPRLDSPPQFDLILLGLGDDGHTASLFPGMPSLEVQAAWVVSSPPGVLPPPVDRLTLTYPVLNAAKNVLFLVAGEKKADTLHAVLEGGVQPTMHPAVGVRPTDGALAYLLDTAASSKLSQK